MTGFLVQLFSFIILLLPCSLAHLHARNTTIKLLVSHIHAHNSPLRPTECLDDGCISEFNKQRLSASHEARMARGRRGKFSKSAPAMASNQSTTRRQPVPWAPVALNNSIDAGGDYYLSLWMGEQQRQEVLLILDTASEMLSIQCDPCMPCRPQALPIFDPATAGSRYVVPEDHFCRQVQSDPDIAQGTTYWLCKFRIDYGENTTTSGAVVDDSLWLRNLENPTSNYTLEVPGIGFGCGFSNEGAAGSLASGTLGLARGIGLSLPEQLGAAPFQLGASFSYCLPTHQHHTGFLILGDNCFPPNGYHATALVNVQPMPGRVIRFWHIDVVGIKIDGSLVALPQGALDTFADGSGGTIFNSGATISYLSQNIYFFVQATYRTTYESKSRSSLGAPHGDFDTCYENFQDINLPIISFILRDGQEFMSRNVYVYIGSNGIRSMCWPYLMDPNPIHAIELGSLAQQSTRMIFDTVLHQFGWKYNDC